MYRTEVVDSVGAGGGFCPQYLFFRLCCGGEMVERKYVVEFWALWPILIS